MRHQTSGDVEVDQEIEVDVRIFASSRFSVYAKGTDLAFPHRGNAERENEYEYEYKTHIYLGNC